MEEKFIREMLLLYIGDWKSNFISTAICSGILGNYKYYCGLRIKHTQLGRVKVIYNSDCKEIQLLSNYNKVFCVRIEDPNGVKQFQEVLGRYIKNRFHDL